MLRAMLDTMVFDALHDDPVAREAVLQAVRERRLELCTTLVQEDQLAAVGDPLRRRGLQALPRRVVPAAVVARGVSRTGRAVLDEGGDALVRGTRHAADELIADAALAHADVLVTEDRRLLEHAAARGLTAWRTARLVTAATA